MCGYFCVYRITQYARGFSYQQILDFLSHKIQPDLFVALFINQVYSVNVEIFDIPYVKNKFVTFDLIFTANMSSSSSDSDSSNNSVWNRLTYIQNQIAYADPQNLFYLYDSQYLSPLNAYWLQKSLLSLELSDVQENGSFCIRFNVYQNARQTDTPLCIDWAQITYLQMCKSLGILNKVYNIIDYWDDLNCSSVLDGHESHDFHFFLYLFKLQIEGVVIASDFEIITEELPVPPPNSLSLSWGVLTRSLTLSQQNQIHKILFTHADTRTLSLPIGTLHTLPYLNETKLFHEVPIIFHFNFIRNLVLNFPFTQVHSELLREFLLCPYCDHRTLFIPGDFCLHSCTNCQTLGQCLPYSDCESKTEKNI